MIHVCFGLYDKTGCYSKFTGTAIASLFENTCAEVTVHILHDNTLSAANHDKFIYLAGRYNQRVNFYNVEELCAEKIFMIKQAMPAISKSVYSIATFYRFLIPQLFPPDIEKIIYLDSDIIVNLDIKELWQIELKDCPVGVVPAVYQSYNLQERLEWMNKTFKICHDDLVKFEDYFNAGVLLMNLKIFRAEEDTVIAGIKFIAEHPEYEFFDQDVLNYCFAARALKLPVKFNRTVNYERLEGDGEIAKKIYHYVGQNPTWSFNLDMNDPFNRLWMEYFIKTPCFDVTTIGRLYASVQNLHVELKQALIQLSALMSGKTRVFFTLPENAEATREIFSVKPDEAIILFESEESLDKLIAEMIISRDKKLFFIMVMNFPFDVLINAGFVYGQDFLDGTEFFSEAQGFPLDSHRLLKAM